MTTAGQGTDSPATEHAPGPAPGGAARLAGRVLARIGFGAMQLTAKGGARVQRRAVLAPADDPTRLNGTPMAFRFAWPDPSLLLSAAG